MNLYDELEKTVATQGPEAGINRLITELREQKNYGSLFYALLMKKRHELGVSPVATGTNQDLPAAAHQGFEEGIREAARTVGQLYLTEGNLPAAWAYFRMLGENEPVRQALDKYQPGAEEDVHPLIDIAFHQGVHPKKGFDWILGRYGTCSAITTMGGGEVPFPPDVKAYCIERLVHTLHEELTERLKAEIQRVQGFQPTGKSIPELLAGRDWLFADDCYHIDISHLSSVVQMSMQLDTNADTSPRDASPLREQGHGLPSPTGRGAGGEGNSAVELKLARELCAYGKNLSPRFKFQGDPPFENHYHDFDMYLAVLTGDDVDGGLAHFRQKAEEADPETIGTYPAEVLVNLLLRIGRPKDALAVARKHLAKAGDMRLSCPSIVDLCQQTGDFQTLAEVALEQSNPVNYVAGLIAQRGA
ncbi:MAG: hypothetical protein L0Y72_02575 [Gemmataceae bacterium]|nr:hypothetical protein [Gemmataceae bacterium]MCI0737902.1 hypothetical protein [Gemmataceae bacterium]